ncbi:T9SS type A sorting domain-containing protein [Polaribacter haliotis]|uniref:T9SS type A sorting domain-containing protein n=1 Tax=Polaribacter haliotis TaxID=1888915 RepID=A0A7L8AK46_9FLAO|nr:T9SS type A sorting domain-containing protein [Polaribacter haliotis]QOD62337.1 T9SS type A sorting domain-containing protein [Polaribacter haliotis]
MKKITIKKAFAILAFLFIGSITFAQIQPAGKWSPEGDLNILKVTGDADNGDGVSDGALNFNGVGTVVGQGGVFTFDGTMQEGKNYTINSALYNANGSFVKVRVSLHNKTDNTELAVYIDAGTQMNNGDIESVVFSYTAVSTDAGDVLELRFIRNDDGNPARDFRVDNVNLNGDTVGARTIVYSEDFRFASTARGFEAKIITDGGHTAPANILNRVNDIPDLADSNNLFDPSIDREANRIPNGTVRNQKTISTRGDNGTTNFAVDAYAVFTTLDLTSSNTEINPSDDFVYASFWTQRRFAQGDIATITARVSTDYAGDASTATWTTVPLHSGKFGNSTNDDQTFVKGIVDLSAYTSSSTVTFAIRYQGSTSAYSSSNRNGTFYISDLQFIAQETPIINVWNGASAVLTAESNWNTKAAPVTTTNNYVFPSGLANYPTITGTLVANNITIEDGASLVTNGATITSNITYKRQLTTPTPTGNPVIDNLEGWHLVSSPVLNQALNDTFISGNSIASGSLTRKGVATYTENGNIWDYFENTETATFAKGQGYSIKRSSTGNVSFNGNLHLADVETATLTRATDGFQLVGNPFPAYISSKSFLDNNAILSANKMIWIWNDSSNSYDSYVSTTNFIIAPGQAFFVQVNPAESGTLTFAENNQQHNGSDTFQRSSKTAIKLIVDNGTTNRYAKINYDDNATKSFDSGSDGEVFGGVPNSFELYTQLLKSNQEKKYQIQSLPNSDLESMIIPIGIKTTAREITFSAEASNLPSDLKVFLEDRINSTFTRLDEANTVYKVTLSKALNGTGRFFLHTAQKALSVNDNAILENVRIYKSGLSTLKIVGLQEGKSTIKLFNIIGKKVMQSSFDYNGTQEIALPKLAKGIYIVQLTSKAGKLNKKIILE